MLRGMRTPTDALAELLDSDEDHGCGDLPATACEEVPGNAARIVGAQTLQKISDSVVDAKTVLPWVLGAVGAPASLAGLLVPVRESGSLLPQASLVPHVRRIAVRKRVWVAGAGGQALAAGAMAAAVLGTEGVVAGALVLASLAVLAVARSLSSIASKDVLGRTIPKGQRGRVNGLATTTAGAVTITMGAALALLGGPGAGVGSLASLLAAAAVVWVAAGVVFARVAEPAGPTEPGPRERWLRRSVALLRDDAPFRRYVLARALLLVTALSPPFLVNLASAQVDGSLGALGPFVLAAGVASLVGGWLWGGVADRSSRLAMQLGAGAASLVLLVLLAARQVEALGETLWLYVAAYLALALCHTGARVGRKTYVVDLATGDARTAYVAVSNTAMGVLLLLTGLISAGLAQLGVEVALGFLTLLGIAGVVVARRLPEVTART